MHNSPVLSQLRLHQIINLTRNIKKCLGTKGDHGDIEWSRYLNFKYFLIVLLSLSPNIYFNMKWESQNNSTSIIIFHAQRDFHEIYENHYEWLISDMKGHTMSNTS